MEKTNTLKVSLMDSFLAPLYSDCVYFAPSSLENPLLAIGFYQLNEEEKITRGGFGLYFIKNEFKSFIS